MSGLVGVVVWRERKLRGSAEQTWTGLNLKAAFSDWQGYLKYGLPASIMICLEWW